MQIESGAYETLARSRRSSQRPETPGLVLPPGSGRNPRWLGHGRRPPGALGPLRLACRVEPTRLRAAPSVLGTLAGAWVGNGFLAPSLVEAGTDSAAALDAVAARPGAAATAYTAGQARRVRGIEWV